MLYYDLHFGSSKHPPIDRLRRAVLCVLRTFCSPNRFHMMSHAICASLLLVMVAYAAAVTCSNDCTNEALVCAVIGTSHAAMPCYKPRGPRSKRMQMRKKRWRLQRRRWRRRYYAPPTPTPTLKSGTSVLPIGRDN